MTPSLYWGQSATISTMLKLGYKGVILLDMLDVDYLLMGDVWFSLEFQTIVDDGWHYTNKVFLLYEFEPGWRIGAMWENFHIFNSGYTRQIINFGFMADRKLFWNQSLIFLTGYHLENPDFVGLRLWTAILKEWDL
jgi:hypothetical protein